MPHIGNKVFGLNALGDMMDKDNQHRHRQKRKQHSDVDGNIRHERRLVDRAHGAQYQKRVDEGSDERAEGKLHEPVGGEVPQHPWSELR